MSSSWSSLETRIPYPEKVYFEQTLLSHHRYFFRLVTGQTGYEDTHNRIIQFLWNEWKIIQTAVINITFLISLNISIIIFTFETIFELWSRSISAPWYKNVWLPYPWKVWVKVVIFQKPLKNFEAQNNFLISSLLLLFFFSKLTWPLPRRPLLGQYAPPIPPLSRSLL